MKKSVFKAIVLGSFLFFAGIASASDLAVKITPDLGSIQVKHDDQIHTIQRDQNQANVIDDKFAKTSRRCPPFCIQPIKLADGVETIDELKMLDYLKRVSEGDDSVLVIDSRGIKWVKAGTIPGTVNIHYKKLSLRAAKEEDVAEIVEDTFGATRTSEFWNFSNAKTLVLYCNGMWCGQAPTNIKSLMRIGYPASKLKWYRGGMQSWKVAGLTTIEPKVDETEAGAGGEGEE